MIGLEFFFPPSLPVYTKTATPYLIGLARPPSRWDTPFRGPDQRPDHVWLSGRPLDLLATGPYWREGNPDNGGGDSNVVALRPSYRFQLDDVRPASRLRRYVCEKPYDG